MDIQDIVSRAALARIAVGLTIVVLLARWARRRRDGGSHGTWQGQGRRLS